MSLLKSSSRDITYTTDGDFYFDFNKDALSISDNKKLNLLKQMIQKRLESSAGDWNVKIIHPTSNLDVYFGNPINETLLDNLRQSIISCLTIDGLLHQDDIIVYPLKVSSTEVYIAIQIKNLKYENNLENSLNIQMVYDTRFNKSFVRILNLNELYKGTTNG